MLIALIYSLRYQIAANWDRFAVAKEVTSEVEQLTLF
jgi:hypothetical protein